MPGAELHGQVLTKFSALLANPSIGIAFARDGRFEQTNAAFDLLFGYPVGSLIGQPLRGIWPSTEDYESVRALTLERLSKGLPVEFRRLIHRRDGTAVMARMSASLLEPIAAETSAMMWLAMDTTRHHQALIALRQSRANLEQQVSERTAALAAANERLEAQVAERLEMEQRVRQLADLDSLTGLPNRRVLESRLDEFLAAAKSQHAHLGLLFIDLDRFKVINDSLGHETGDALLKLVAMRLRELTRASDVLGRFGGDEFVMILPQVETVEMVDATAARLVEELSRPYPLQGQLLHMTPSIGGAVYPLHGHDRKGLLSRADAAMYHAKSLGRRCYQMFSPKVQHNSAYRLKLQNDLHLAITCQELYLEYQPRVDIHTGRISGSEALVRWRHPTLGQLGPLEFIPIAEQCGLIERIGEWILREACKQQAGWIRQGLPALPIAVNLSVQQLGRPGLAALINLALGETGLPPNLLEIEITESMLLHGTAEIVDGLRSLREAGVRISIDDFGMGYSSLVYLKKFPLDSLKIDQTFVRDINSDPDDAIIVETIIGLARNLRKRVIAEGVETQAQLDFLRKAGCDEYQGYLFSPSLSAERFEILLRAEISVPVESGPRTTPPPHPGLAPASLATGDQRGITSL